MMPFVASGYCCAKRVDFALLRDERKRKLNSGGFRQIAQNFDIAKCGQFMFKAFRRVEHDDLLLVLQI